MSSLLPRRSAALALLTLLVAVFTAACTAEPAPPPAPATPAAALPQFLNYGADKCIPCRQMVPVRESVARDYAGQINVTFIDVWADRDAGRARGIRIIPTQVILDASGQEVYRHVGYWPLPKVVEQLTALGLIAEPTPAKPAPSSAPPQA